MRILLAQINTTIGDFEGNRDKILFALHEGRKKQVDLVLFPEMAITGYPAEDLLLLPHFLDAAEESLAEIIRCSIGLSAIVGLPRRSKECGEKPLFNSAAIISNGALVGYHDKMLLPTYDVFDERRYFAPGTSIRTWNIVGKKVGVTICEDLWEHSSLLKESAYCQDPIKELATQQPDLILNLSGSPYSYGKRHLRASVCQKAAATAFCPVLLCNQVGGNDSLIFDGGSCAADAAGRLISFAKTFDEELLIVDTEAEHNEITLQPPTIQELYEALVLGLKDYFHKSGFQKACLGISGGIDSAVVACLAVEALGSQNVMALAMPSRYSSNESFEDAEALIQRLNIEMRTLSIEPTFKTYLDLLSSHFQNMPIGVAEENLQARIRGMLLMAFSNKMGSVVLSTGNKSEMAMGYSTLYGDMCGGLSVIGDVTKGQVYALANWINRNKEIIPQRTLMKPPSAELRPNQKDSDTLPPYDIIDEVLAAYVEDHQTPEEIISGLGYESSLVNDLILRIHQNEYKRRQAAPSLRVSERAFAVGRRFPIVQRFVRK